jgi:hypothetical protein
MTSPPRAKEECIGRRAAPSAGDRRYRLVDVLSADELAIAKKVRAYMESKVKPVTSRYWSDDALPEKPTITSTHDEHTVDDRSGRRVRLCCRA